MTPALQERLPVAAFWLAAGVLVLLRHLLVSDLPVQVVHAPHDDSLYVTRAFHLLGGGSFGPYDSHTLSKLPGISWLLAAISGAGIPYPAALNALYAGAGVYLVAALRGAGARAWLCLLALALYLFNPVSLGVGWLRLIREPVGTGLFVLLLGAMAHLLVGARTGWRIVPHVIVLSAVFAASLLVREDDRLLWIALALFIGAMAWANRTALRATPAAALPVVLCAVLPALAAFAGGHAARGFIDRHYGSPILNDFSEGEFPKMIAAIRRIESATDNRLVMVPQDVLPRLRAAVPETGPIIDRLPAVGSRTFSCRLHGVCTEWSNGWMLWWIKDAAYRAGSTPDLPAAQAFFRAVRTQVEQGCDDGRLACRAPTGDSLLPPMQLRWTRAFVHEFASLLGMLVAPAWLAPAVSPVSDNVAPELRARFQAVTRSVSPDPMSGGTVEAGGRAHSATGMAVHRSYVALATSVLGALLVVLGPLALLGRWALYPSVALSPAFLLGAVLLAFAAARLLALAYVAVYFGNFEPRMILALYSALLLVTPLIIHDFLSARSRHLELKPNG